VRSPVKQPIDAYQWRRVAFAIEVQSVFRLKAGVFSMGAESHKRNRLMPWSIGLVIILAGVIFVGYRMQASNCGISLGLELIVLAVMPAVYLVLMYLTLTSQE